MRSAAGCCHWSGSAGRTTWPPADTRRGRRPSWSEAAPGEVAEPLVDEVVAELRRRACTVATGMFGARMQVSSVNDGPMTVLLEV